MIRLIGLDLDGTLLTKDKKLTDTNALTLREAARAGAVVVPVTGRPYFGIPAAVMDLEFVRYVITSNGAVTTDRRADGPDRPIRERYMAVETVRNVFDTVADPRHTIMEFFTGGYGYDDRRSRELLMRKFAGTPLIPYLEKSRIVVEDLYEALSRKGREIGGIENISIMCRSFEEREGVRNRVARIDGVRIIQPAPTDLEITASNADKGTALLALAQMIGIRQEEILTMGDGNNDMNLLQSAGISIAMGNASEKIRQMADYITEDNEHDGVAAAIRRFVLTS